MKKLLLTTLLLSVFGLVFGQTEFITTWKTDNPSGTSLNTTNTQIKLPVTGTSYSGSWFKVGTPSTNGTFDQTSNGLIDFPEAGTYQITFNAVSTNFAFYFGNVAANTDCKKLMQVTQWGSLWTLRNNNMFYGCENLDVIATDIPTLSGNISGMFHGCAELVGNNKFNDWQTASVTNLATAFRGASKFNQPIGNWNTSNVTSMSAMFQDATTFNQPINSWIVSKVTNANAMFRGATNFNQELNSWVWSTTSNITMSGMFFGATIFNGSISSWNTERVTNMSTMFRDATSFNKPLTNWNTGNVTDMSGMFQGSTSFNQSISHFNVSSVTSLNNTFDGASNFNQNLGAWVFKNDVSSNNMFRNSGIDATNYNNTLIGWATNLPNAAVSPTSIGVTGRTYTTQQAKDARDAIALKGWTLDGDIDGTVLPVTFININASITGNQFSVKWQTASEKDNDYFLIYISQDGKEWEQAAKIASKAVNGNASSTLDYEYSSNITDHIKLASFSILGGVLLLLLFLKNRNRLVACISPILFIAVLLTSSCNKNELAPEQSKKTLYVKILQVDKNGETGSESEVVLAKAN